MEERPVYFVGEKGNGRFAGNVNQVLKGVARNDSTSWILRIAVQNQRGQRISVTEILLWSAGILDDDQLGIGTDQSLELLKVEPPSVSLLRPPQTDLRTK